MELKEPLSFEKQIEKLKSHGMVMEDEARVKEILAEINYYRFTGYTLQYRKNPDESDYIEGLPFEKAYHIYQLNVHMRLDYIIRNLILRQDSQNSF